MLDKAKKIVLSVSVIVLFALYAVREKERAPLQPPAVVAGPAVTRTATSSSVAPTVTTAASRPVATATATTPPLPTYSILAPTETPVPTATAQAAAEAHSTASAGTGSYRDGTYTGSVADANWGNVEVQAVITNGRISDVQFLEYPNHRSRSQMINEQAMPQLTQEAITSQQANVDIVTGATDTSEAFIESLGAALKQASA